jgi:hypothetical protein
MSRNPQCSLSSPNLVAQYLAMSADKSRETEALEWAEATVLDVASETR